jgi:hypothetical protein
MRRVLGVKKLARRGRGQRNGLHTHLTRAKAANFRIILGTNAA